MQNNDNQKTYFIYIRSTGDYIPDRILLEQLFTTDFKKQDNVL